MSFAPNLNFKDALFTFICYRKHLLKDTKYYVYVMSRQIIISSVSYTIFNPPWGTHFATSVIISLGPTINPP